MLIMLCSHLLIVQTGTVPPVKETPVKETPVKETPVKENLILYLAIGLLFFALVVTVTVSGTVCHRMGKLNKRLKRY